MNRSLGSSDSLGALMSICPSSDNNNKVYGREFEAIFDGLDEVCVEDQLGQKKRRLSVDQVKALEKNFEVDNKLEPDRKVKLAQELGLQPRQVAVWFQNRRARWKTKQLERDYGVLKANYDSLKLDYDSLHLHNEAILKEISELKAKLNKDKTTESNVSVKEEIVLPESDEKVDKPPLVLDSRAPASEKTSTGPAVVAALFPELKDGSSDSDSSAILNDDSTPNPAISSENQENHKSPSSFGNLFQFSKTTAYPVTQSVKMEEHNFFSSEEACNFFCDEQPPSLQWYCNQQWN